MEVSATKEVAVSFGGVRARWASLNNEVGDGVIPAPRTAVPHACAVRRWPWTWQWARQWLSQDVGDEQVLLVQLIKEARKVKGLEAVCLLTMSPYPITLVPLVGK